MAAPDIALVSLGTTPGLRRADDAFAQLARDAGVSCDVVSVRIGPERRLRRQTTITDLIEALAARRASSRADARAVVYSSVTAALLSRRPDNYAIRFDAPAALNRPGLSGAWQRRAERKAFGGASALLPWGEVAAAEAGPHPQVIALPVPVEPLPGAPERDIDAVAYAGYPWKRGLDLVCSAWDQVAPDGARLVIGGVHRERGLEWLRRCGVPEPEGVEWAGPLPREDWLEHVGRARVFVNGSRWEDHGLAQLEALSAGAALVTVPSAGAYEALPLARELDPRLVSIDLAAALEAGLGMSESERAGYARRAGEALAPYRPAAVLRTMEERVLPALGLR